MKFYSLIVLLPWALLFSSCIMVKKGSRMQHFQYESFKATMMRSIYPAAADTTNIFDANRFIPGKDSLNTLLQQMDTLWKYERLELKKAKAPDKAAKEEIKVRRDVLHTNIQSLSTFREKKSTSTRSACRAMECPLVAEVIKSKQTLYVYIGGAVKDSFAVSTGVPGRETPDMNQRPSGPVLIRYTSTKFPGGNYRGLGNMPYAVFVKGGYAIHGTTPGNFVKLGTRASHGCIRLHPDNAKIFYELVNIAGLKNTWVIIR